MVEATCPNWAVGRVFLRPVFYLGNNRISQVGVMLTTASAITLLTFYTTEFFGIRVTPYVGIITFLILPAIFVFGLVLIPVGITRRFHREKLAGVLPSEYPQIDLGDPKLRETILFVMVMSGVNLALFLTVTYRGVHYMDSIQFCGLTCHTVMQPEYIAYSNSPHARVACVECHIGPGAPWFVRSKLSGAYQVVSVNFNLYSRPIPTPIEDLRPSRETCEQCHWPLKFHGDKLAVKTHYEEDEENTQTKTVLLMHTGGIDPLTQEPQGNHGVHLQPSAVIQYYPSDEERQEIPYVWYQRADGEVIEYISDVADQPLEELQAQPRRIMDCMDCHNRPTHTFQLPATALDQALAARQIDPGLPYIRPRPPVHQAEGDGIAAGGIQFPGRGSGADSRQAPGLLPGRVRGTLQLAEPLPGTGRRCNHGNLPDERFSQHEYLLGDLLEQSGPRSLPGMFPLPRRPAF
jgi:hypothetical protein